MRISFLLLFYSLQVLPVFSQVNNESKQLIIKPIKGAWVKLADSEKITDSTEAFGYIDYNFLHFDPSTKLVEVSYSNQGEWIPRGKGYFTLFDIQPYISMRISPELHSSHE